MRLLNLCPCSRCVEIARGNEVRKALRRAVSGTLTRNQAKRFAEIAIAESKFSKTVRFDFGKKTAP